MKYYVPVGPGGVVFRIGMVVTGMMGSVVYWRASRRRGVARPLKLIPVFPKAAGVLDVRQEITANPAS